METKLIIDNIYNSCSDNTTQTVVEDGIKYEVKLSTNNNICKIEVETKCVDADKNAKEYIEILNAAQTPLYKYSVSNNKISCCFNVWVDSKINKSTLSGLLGNVFANYKSALMFIRSEQQ